MRVLDTPVRLAAGRTPRELVLIGHLVGCIATSLYRGDHSWNVYAYAGVAIVFAARFWAARVLYLTLAIGAAALQASSLLLPHVHLADRAAVLVQILGLALLLCGGDLIRRFDDEGRALGPLRNLWRPLSVPQRRHLAWGLHLIGATGGLLHHAINQAEGPGRSSPAWMWAAIAACTAVGVLYLWGRAIAPAAAVAAGAAIAWKLTPWLGDADRALHHRAVATATVRAAPHYVLGAFACAVAAALIALPWAIRWMRLAAR